MNSRIQPIVQTFLDHGVISSGFEITPIFPLKKVTEVKWMGSLLVTDPDGVQYSVTYQALRPLHAESGGELNLISSITTMT